MIWSQLRKRVRDLIVPELRDRIDFHATRYHSAPDQEGETWITVDKVKVLGGSYWHWCVTMADESMRTGDFHADGGDDPGFASVSTDSAAVWALQSAEVHSGWHIRQSLFNYLNTPIDAALESTNPFFCALAIVDRRVGRRRFLSIVLSENEHSLVKRFFELRRALYAPRNL